jgi:hypothetical protein
MKYIYVGEELLLTTWDGDNDDGCDCPEDMIWRRDIKNIFFAGVKAGRMTKNDNEIEVLDKEKEISNG